MLLAKSLALISASWAIMGLLCGGVGLLIRRLAGSLPEDAAALPAAFWAGWIAVTGVAQVWHLWLPVDWRLLAALVPVALAGYAATRRSLGRLLARPRPFYAWGVLIGGLGAAVLALAVRALVSPLNADYGLYYAQSVKWAATYPIVPGLGNLHGRLAFNSAHFLYGALVEALPLGVRSIYTANGLFVAAFAAQALLAGLKLLRAQGGASLADTLLILMVPGTIAQTMTTQYTLSPDMMIFVLGLVQTVELVRLLEAPRAADGRLGWRVALIAGLAAAGMAVKLSFVALGGSSLAIALLVWGRRSGWRSAALRRTLLGASGVAALLLVPWLARGAILSGYPAYPSAFPSLPVPWAVPREQVIAEARGVWDWAHYDGQFIGAGASGGWFGPWLERASLARMEFVVPLVLALAAWLATLIAVAASRGARRSAGIAGLAAIPSLASLLFWFIAAPDLRFAGAAFWLLAATGVLALAEQGLSGWPALRSAAITALTALLAFFAARPFSLPRPEDIPDVAGERLPPVETFVTDSGLVLVVPDTAECFDAALPCTPYPQRALRLREPGDPGAGFVIGQAAPEP